MIIGVGTDLVRIARIAAAVQRRGDSFAKRILTPTELGIFSSRRNPSAYLAKRFAAKEALGKALGTGIGPISWQDVEITNAANGSPSIALSGVAKKLCEERGGTCISLSLSDEREYALAFVVISR